MQAFHMRLPAETVAALKFAAAVEGKRSQDIARDILIAAMKPYEAEFNETLERIEERERMKYEPTARNIS